MNAGSRRSPHAARWSEWLPSAVLVLLLLAVGLGIYRKTSQAVAPPMYDALSYYAKAASVWRALGSGKLVNPLNVEPVVRPPGAILLSGPLGFSPDFRAFFFRATIVPIALFVGACWLVAHERLRDPRERWLITGACTALLALPMFYHFEPSDILPVPTSWGLVDGFLASVAAMATALLLLGARRRSLALTVGGTLAGAFTLVIKPSGLFAIPVIFWGWLIELLIVHWPVRRTWRENSRFRVYAVVSGVVILVVLGATAFACFHSRYLSSETIAFFANSQRLLRAMYRHASLASLILPQVHPWLGWHWTVLFAVIVGSSVRGIVRGFRHGFEAENVRFLAASVALGGGVVWWIWWAGPSEIRYVLPFVLVFVVVTMPGALSRASGLPPWARCLCCLALAAPVVLLTLLLWADRPSVFLQRLLGVSLASGQFREEVRMGNILADAARALGRDLSVYSVEVDNSHGMVEAVGEYRQLVEPNEKVFRTRAPIDWIRPPLIRRYELLTSDYVLFRPLRDAAEIERWMTAETVDGFEAETRATRAWLTGAGAPDGFDVTYDGSLRLVKVVDLDAADRSFGVFLGRRRWRDVFQFENGAPLLASEADIERTRAAATPGTSRVEFGGRFRLHGAMVMRLDGAVRMELLWEHLAAEPANWWVFVHVLDGHGTILSQADYPVPRAVPARRLWRDRVVWSTEQLRGATQLGIGIHQPNAEMLGADRGDRDWNGTRLLIGLPR